MSKQAEIREGMVISLTPSWLQEFEKEAGYMNRQEEIKEWPSKEWVERVLENQDAWNQHLYELERILLPSSGWIYEKPKLLSRTWRERNE